MRLIKSSEIPDFVAEMNAARRDICAVGHYMYVTGDMDPRESVINEVQRIGEKHGDRDPMRQEIIDYL